MTTTGLLKKNTNSQISLADTLARAGGKAVANILGTEVLDNSTSTLTNCSVVNVLLPLTVGLSEVPGTHKVMAGDEAMKAYLWMLKTLMEEYKTFIPVALLYDQWWVRLCAQIYLDMDDFVWAGKTLKELCDRVRNREYLEAEK